MKDLSYQSATQLLAALAKKKISSLELLEETISHIEKLDKRINAVVVKDFDRARASAKAADKAIARGKQLPLLGLPMTVKESFNVIGLPTTWGHPQYKNWVPSEDSLVIRRLKAAGAIIIGKTNVPFMLGDWQSFNDIYGTTNNPWDVKVSPGGSSGGAAAALAAGLVSLELGSDLAGSLRVPAHFCGIFAHKPTFGLVPLRGVSPPAAPVPGYIDFVVAGPMARTATDLSLELAILAGPDEKAEGKGYQLSLPPPRHKKLNHYKVLVIDSHPLCPTANSTAQSMDRLTKNLVKAGVRVSRDSKKFPDLANIARTYSTLLGAFLTMNTPPDLYDTFKLSAQKLQDKDMSLLAHHMRGSVCSHYEWLRVSRIREQLYQSWRELYKEFDVVICPTMPTPAFPHDHSDFINRKIEINGTWIPFGDQKIWVSIATLFKLPATIVPIDRTEAGLPIGVQIIGDYLEDNTTIQFAKLLEREFGSFLIPNLDTPHPAQKRADLSRKGRGKMFTAK